MIFFFVHRYEFTVNTLPRWYHGTTREKLEQAEAEVVPSSSLVESEVKVGVEVGVWVKMQFSFLTFSVGWVCGVG